MNKDQATKSVWWMPWHQAPKKDVISCDKLRGAANELIRRCPNEETHYVEDIVSLHEYIV